MMILIMNKVKIKGLKSVCMYSLRILDCCSMFVCLHVCIYVHSYAFMSICIHVHMSVLMDGGCICRKSIIRSHTYRQKRFCDLCCILFKYFQHFSQIRKNNNFVIAEANGELHTNSFYFSSILIYAE